MCDTCGCGQGEPASVHVVPHHKDTRDHSLGHDHDHDHDHDDDHAVHDHDRTQGDYHQAVGHQNSVPTSQESDGQSASHTRGVSLSVGESLLDKNDQLAEANRRLFQEHGILALNLLSSPGSGKTTLLERALRHLCDRVHTVVVEGDQQTDRDAQRIAATGTPVAQVTTGLVCHLDAGMVAQAIQELPLQDCRLLVIENVGNLICPSLFDLGEGYKVVMMSVTEGEDKPIKYPHMFRGADLVLLNKTDLLPHLEFDLEQCEQYLNQVNPDVPVIKLSARTGEGMEAWYAWLDQRLATPAIAPAGS